MTAKQKRDEAVDALAKVMKARLDKKYREGKRGWDNSAVYSYGNLLADLRKDVESLCGTAAHDSAPCTFDVLELAVDVANRAMFVWFRNLR